MDSGPTVAAVRELLRGVVLVTGNRNKIAEARRLCGAELEAIELELPEIQSLDLEEVLRAKGEEAFRRLRRPLIVEETGLELAAPLEKLSTFYLSPGACSESMELYLAKVRKPEDSKRYAGIKEEAEDIKIRVLSLENAIKLIEIGHIQDAKTIIALLMLKDRVWKQTDY